MKKETIKSRYGDDRLFFYEDSKWFIDLKECHLMRYVANDKLEVTGIDPSGGPYIAIGDKLSYFSKALPDITITMMKHVKDSVYQLTH